MALLVLVLPAWGQGPPAERRGRRPPPPPEGCETTQPAPEERPPWGRGGAFGAGRRGPGWELGRHLFRLLPEERGPLAPGEDEELLVFVRRHMPRLADALERLRERDPEQFHARLTEQAPRLRHLRRIHDLSPRLAEIIKQHADNMLQVHRAQRSLRHGVPPPPEGDALERDVRRRIADSVRLEIEALSVLADALEQHRADRVAERLARWLAVTGNLADESDEVADAVAAYHEARTDAARGAAVARLEQVAAAQVEDEITGLRRHARQMEADLAGEVDRRMSELREVRPPRRRPGGL